MINERDMTVYCDLLCVTTMAMYQPLTASGSQLTHFLSSTRSSSKKVQRLFILYHLQLALRKGSTTVGMIHWQAYFLS